MLKHSINLVSTRREYYQAKLVFYLFIASLSMFFLASLLTYCLIRTEAFRDVYYRYDQASSTFVPTALVYQQLRLPLSFWISTGFLVLISVLLQRACWNVHRERQPPFRNCLIWSGVLAMAFVVVQAFGMTELLRQHFSQTDGSTKVYGMSFTLAFIHALHVIGGLIFLGFVLFQSYRNRYDHERHWAVDHCAGYWHFLDVVWASMLVVFVVTR